MDLYDSLAAGIARVEGFAPGTRADQNNNPGNLRDASGTIWPNLPHDSGGFVVFPSPSMGWAALKRDLQLKAARGWTLEQAMRVYAPASDNNDPAAYAATLARSAGIPSNVPLQALAAGYTGGGLDYAALSLPDTETMLMGAAVVAGVSLLWLLVA